MLASDFLFDECPDMSKKHASADCEYTEAGVSQPCLRCEQNNATSSLASDFLFDECPDMSKQHASANCEYTEAGVSQPCLRCK